MRLKELVQMEINFYQDFKVQEQAILILLHQKDLLKKVRKN